MRAVSPYLVDGSEKKSTCGSPVRLVLPSRWCLSPGCLKQHCGSDLFFSSPCEVLVLKGSRRGIVGFCCVML